MGKGLNIKRALLEYNEANNEKKRIGVVAEKVYPDLVNPSSKVTGVINGSIKVSKGEVMLFCEELKCDPNKLFGYGKQ